MSVPQRSGTTTDHPDYPDLKQEIGENPARYLHDLDETAFCRIRGIRREQVLDAWVEVEADLGPRKAVMAALNQQRARLTGDRDE